MFHKVPELNQSSSVPFYRNTTLNYNTGIFIFYSHRVQKVLQNRNDPFTKNVEIVAED